MGVLIPLGPSPPLLRITAGRLEDMADQGALNGLGRLELRDGVLCQMSPQYRPHFMAKTVVYDALRDALRALGSPLGVVPEGSVRISDHEVPMPDVFVWEPVRGKGAAPAHLVRLVAEISDTTLADDLGRKPLVYAAGGIGEYWVVDLPGQRIHQHWSPGEGGYAQLRAVPFGQTLVSEAIPGLSIGTEALL